MKGYGEMIRRAREAVPWDHAQLAKKVDRTISTVRRWEDETNEPSIDSINLLVENLPLSTEMLLKAMGAKLTPIGAQKLPRRLVEMLLAMTPEQHQNLMGFLADIVQRSEAK